MEFNYKQIFTKLSTSIEMKVFMFMHLIFGDYFKAFSSKTASIILRLYCCLITMTMVIVCSMNAYKQPILYAMATNICEIVISFIISQIISRKHLVTFANALNTLDGFIGFKTKSNLLNKSFLLVFTIDVLLSSFGLIFGLTVLLPASYYFTYLCFLCMRITNMLIYCRSGIVISLMHHRLNSLKKYLEKNDIPDNIIGSEGINERIHVVRKSIFYYDNILDAFDAIDFFMQFEVLLICTAHLFKYIIFFHAWITAYFLTVDFTSDLLNVVSMTDVLFEMVMTFSSCVMMCLSNNEIDQIKKTLVLQIIGCSDVSLREELENLLQHITRRPFRFILLRAVPVDLYLPISIISSGITYVILLLQFTHFGSNS